MADGPWTQFEATASPTPPAQDGPWSQFQAPPASRPQSEGGFGAAFGAALESTPETFGKGIEALGTAGDMESVAQAGRWIMDKTKPAASGYVPLEWKDIDGAEGVWNWVKEQAGAGLGSTVIPAASAAVGALGGGAVAGPPGAVVGALGGAAASGIPLNIGDAVQQFEDEGIEKKLAAKAGVIVGAVISVPDVFALGVLTKPLTGAAKKAVQDSVIKVIAGRLATGMTVEGATEGLQQLIQETSAHFLGGDASLSSRVERVAGSVVGGAVGGGVFGGAAGAGGAVLHEPQDIDTPLGDKDLEAMILGGERDQPRPEPQPAGGSVPGEQLPLPLQGKAAEPVARPEPEPGKVGEQVAAKVEEPLVKPEEPVKPGGDGAQQGPLSSKVEVDDKTHLSWTDAVYNYIKGNPNNVTINSQVFMGGPEAVAQARKAMRARQNYDTLWKQDKKDLANRALELSFMSMKKAVELGFRFDPSLAVKPVKPAEPQLSTPTNKFSVYEAGQHGEAVGSFGSFAEADTFMKGLGTAGKYQILETSPGYTGVRGSNPPVGEMLASAPEFKGKEGKLVAQTFGAQQEMVLSTAYPDLAAFKAGPKRVLVVGEHPEKAGLEKFANLLTRKFLPGKKIILQLGDRPGYEGQGALAHFRGTDKGVGVVYFSPMLTDKSPRSQVITELAHEFGHAIVWARWAETSTDTQQAIYRAFTRHLERTKGKSAADFFLDFMSPMQLMKHDRAALDRLHAKDRREALSADHWLGKWYDFDEWIAEQVNRYLLNAERATTLVDKWFKSVADSIKRMFSILKDTDFAAEPEVTRWLDAMRNKTGQTAPQSLLGAMEGYRNGVTANAVALGTTDVAGVAPPQTENIYMKNALAAVGGSRKQKAQLDQYTSWLRFWPNLLQITEKNRHILGLQKYTEFVREWQIAKMQIVSNADGTVKDWRRLGKEQSGKLSQLLYDLDAMVYLKPGENTRWPTAEELIAMAKKRGLSSAAVKMYYKVKNDFLDILSRIEKAWIKDAQRTLKDPLAIQQAMFNIAMEMSQLRGRPYFPHERFGDWTVTHWDAKGKIVHFSQHETSKAANAYAAVRAKQFPGERVGAGKMAEEVKIFRGLPPSLIRQLASKIKGLNASQREQLEQLAFDMSPANSFAKHQMRRKNTPGFSNDGLRSYANYFLHAGNHIARIEWRQDLEDAIGEVENSARGMVGTRPAEDVGKRQGIADWLKRHLEYIMNPPEEWNALRSFAFFYYMGFNASSALVNLTQVPMVAWPYLASRFGDLKAQGALMKATMDLGKLYKLDPKAMSGDEIAAIREGITQGFLDESQNADLAGMAQHGALGRLVGGTKAERWRQNFAYYSSYLFQAIEKANRRVVFRAAFRLAKAAPANPKVLELIQANQILYKKLLGQNWSPENAGAFLLARDAIEKSQFNYAGYARPEFIRGRRGVLFAFWMFKQQMLNFFRNDPGAGRAALVMLAVAGLMGLPFAQDLNDFVKYAARLFGKDFNPEQEARKLVKDLAGMSGADDGQSRRAAEVMMNGFGKESFGLSWVAQGLGIPFPGIDVSSRLGMGHIVPGLEPLMQGLTQELKPDESFGKIAAEVLGASYGVPISILRGLESGDLDEYKTWERLLPSAARNVTRAVRYLEQGGETTRSGASVAQFDVTDAGQAAEVAAQAFGFTPTRVSREWDKIGAQREAIRYWTLRRKIVFDQFDRALRSKDREAVADAKQSLRAFNAEAPDKRLRITVKAVKESFATRQENRRKMERDVALQKTYQGITRDTAGLYPE